MDAARRRLRDIPPTSTEVRGSRGTPYNPQKPLLLPAEQLKRGEILYHEICSGCHGGKAQSAGVMPDLRLMNAATHQIFGQIVLDGVYLPRGMASFADVLNEDDTNLIHAYIVSRAREDRTEALAGDAE